VIAASIIMFNNIFPGGIQKGKKRLLSSSTDIQDFEKALGLVVIEKDDASLFQKRLGDVGTTRKDLLEAVLHDFVFVFPNLFGATGDNLVGTDFIIAHDSVLIGGNLDIPNLVVCAVRQTPRLTLLLDSRSA